LDQQQTAKALEQYQNYVLMYPDGERKADASKAIGELRGKQAKKMYEHANLYLKVGKYQAAAITYKNLISDFPDSEYAPEAMIRMIRAQALFARNSVEDKKAVRYQEALAFYQRFKNRYPDSPKAANADKLKEQIDTEIKNIGTKQKKNKNDVFQ
jgi:outer membrane protein assembly factor BamD